MEKKIFLGYYSILISFESRSLFMSKMEKILLFWKSMEFIYSHKYCNSYRRWLNEKTHVVVFSPLTKQKNY